MPRPSDEEMSEQVNRALNIQDRKGTLYRGMSYEQGVSDTLDWVLGNNSDKPLSDEDAAEFDE